MKKPKKDGSTFKPGDSLPLPDQIEGAPLSEVINQKYLIGEVDGKTRIAVREFPDLMKFDNFKAMDTAEAVKQLADEEYHTEPLQENEIIIGDDYSYFKHKGTIFRGDFVSSAPKRGYRAAK